MTTLSDARPAPDGTTAGHLTDTQRRLLAAKAIIYRACPACAERAGRLVPPDCPVCLGQAVIRLGAAALSVYEPEVVSETIEMAMTEAIAKEQDEPGSITAMLDMLATSGVIHRPNRQQEKPLNTTTAPVTAAPAWVDEWHEDNPAASAAGDIPEATPETIELEAGTATVRTYWQDGAPGHQLELPDTDKQLLSNADLRALAEALQDIADEMQTT